MGIEIFFLIWVVGVFVLLMGRLGSRSSGMKSHENRNEVEIWRRYIPKPAERLNRDPVHNPAYSDMEFNIYYDQHRK